jgi:ABC-2 type transport system permease protein
VAVYKKTYRPYEGVLTPGWSRFLVTTRYAFEEMRRSRFLTIFYLASFLYPLICALILYLRHNTSAIAVLKFDASKLITVSTGFFAHMLGWQSMLAFFLAAFVGPGLISPDLSHNALSLYLARPFSRAEYVLGKMAVLMGLMSLMTWVPGLLLFSLQGYLEGWRWASDNMRIAWALFAAAWVWILVLTLLSLALSAWVKWRPVAGALLFGVFFVAAAFGAAINGVLRTKWGHVINLSYLIGTVWNGLFNLKPGDGAVFFGVPVSEDISMLVCVAALAAVSLFCLYLLTIKIRGAEVVQ